MVFIGGVCALPQCAIITVGILSSCALRYKDVSSDPKYAPLLNSRYSLQTEMNILGVNLPPGYGKDIDVYDICPKQKRRPHGPEIRSENVLEPGTVLEVQGVRRSINHIPGDLSVEALVKLVPSKTATNVPITISLKDLQSTNYAKRMETTTE